MISSITPTTISTVALYGSLPLVSLLVLLILLVMKETATCAHHPNLGKVSSRVEYWYPSDPGRIRPASRNQGL
jgi:hypothetical protein